jgi:DNA-binding transcriptional regulator GbsR (MarR family)
MIATIPEKLIPVLSTLISGRADDPLSTTEIAELANYTERSVQLHLRELESLGFVKTSKGNGRGRKSRYEVSSEVYRYIRV